MKTLNRRDAIWRPEIAEQVEPALPRPLPCRTILVPLDGSSHSEHALPLALEIARQDAARLLLVHVLRPLRLTDSFDLLLHGALYRKLKQKRWDYLNGVVRRVEEVSPVSVTPVLLEEDEVAAALGGLAEGAADLVVMAIREQGVFARFWRGRTASTLMQRLPIPLLLVRGGDEPPNLASRPAVRNVLIPLDGSTFSERVLEPVIAWKTWTDADYTLVHAVDPAKAVHDESANGEDSLSRAAFHRVARRLRRRAFNVNSLVLFDSDPAHAILRHARTQRADLIALATRGHGGLARLFWGSVADRVIRDASVPVLLFRPNCE